MKNITVLVFAIITNLYVSGQSLNENRNSSWPYLFEEFSPCIILHKDGNVSKANANFNFLNEKLQFTNRGQIMDFAEPDDITKASFNDGSEFLYQEDKFYLLLNNQGNVISFYKTIKGNMNDLMEAKGAYGSSTTTAAVKQQADVDIGGINSMDVRMLWDNRSEGKKFRIDENYFFKAGGLNNIISLKKNNLLNAFPRHKKMIRDYLKEEKISLRNDSDIKKLADYINSL